MILREHKFLIFDMAFKNMSEIYKLGSDQIDFPPSKEYPTVSARHDLSEYNILMETDRYVALAFIGQKDRDGNEIFEGHILSGPWVNGHHRKDVKSKNFHVEVKFDDSEFHMHSSNIKNKHTSSFRGLPDWDECEIIGHIFTNPELLIKPIQFPLTPF